MSIFPSLEIFGANMDFWNSMPSKKVFVMCALNHDLNEKKGAYSICPRKLLGAVPTKRLGLK